MSGGKDMRLGFIGVGNLGYHLAASLLRAGFQVTVSDLSKDAAQGLIDAGAVWASSAKEVAVASDSVFTCLPSPAAVAAVVAGPSGILAGLHEGGTWIDMSTNDRNELKRLAALAAERGIHCLEAPVTGGVHKAASGEITVLAGGDPEVFAAHRPALEAMGGKVFHMGPLGSASVIKVITNMLAFIHLVAAGEAMMLAKRGGLDLAQSFEAIKASSGNSFVHETESQLVLNGSYNVGFTMDLAAKDLHFAHELGREFGVPLEVAGLVEQIFVRGRSQYGGERPVDADREAARGRARDGAARAGISGDAVRLEKLVALDLDPAAAAVACREQHGCQDHRGEPEECRHDRERGRADQRAVGVDEEDRDRRDGEDDPLDERALAPVVERAEDQRPHHRDPADRAAGLGVGLLEDAPPGEVGEIHREKPRRESGEDGRERLR